MHMREHIPAGTELEFIGLDRLQKPALRFATGYWKAQRGQHRFPSKNDIKPRDIASVLPHMSLLKVIEGDFVYRVVGDAVVRAFALPLQNRKVSEIVAEAPLFGKRLQAIFVGVAEKGEPAVVRGVVGRDFPQANFTDFENAFLPLGADHRTVDHILTVSSYSLRPSRL